MNTNVLESNSTQGPPTNSFVRIKSMLERLNMRSYPKPTGSQAAVNKMAR